MRTAQTRVIDIKPDNRVKAITKLESGDLQVEQHSGNVFTVSKDDPGFQQFIVYSVLTGI